MSCIVVLWLFFPTDFSYGPNEIYDKMNAGLMFTTHLWTLHNFSFCFVFSYKTTICDACLDNRVKSAPAHILDPFIPPDVFVPTGDVMTSPAEDVKRTRCGPATRDQTGGWREDEAADGATGSHIKSQFNARLELREQIRRIIRQ